MLMCCGKWAGCENPCLWADLSPVCRAGAYTIARTSSSSLTQAGSPVEQMEPDVVLMPTVPALLRLR